MDLTLDNMTYRTETNCSYVSHRKFKIETMEDNWNDKEKNKYCRQASSVNTVKAFAYLLGLT